VDSPFDVLGVDPDADDAEIERAYRRRVKEAHPDHGGSQEEFQRVRAAYEAVKTGNVKRFVASGDARPGTPGENGSTATADPETNGTQRTNGTDPGSGDADGRGTRAENGDDGSADDAGDDGGTADATRVEYLNYETIVDEGWELGDEDVFERAADADLSHEDYGVFLTRPDETLLEAAENRGFAWPFACRGGACANCAVAVLEGELRMPANHVLSAEMLESGIRLSCIGEPITDELRVVYNVKHLPGLDELRLPPQQFGQAADD
jgi:curved DNA-binding protein CbpA